MLNRIHRTLTDWRVRRANRALEDLHWDRESDLWDAVLRGKPRHGRALRRSAELAASRGNLERAEQLWRRALDKPSLEARASGELARLAFDRRDLDLAREHADRFLARSEPDVRIFSLRRQIESLRLQLEQAEPPHRHHQICVTGVAFCGSTLFGHLLNRSPGVCNIGESHWLVHRQHQFLGADIDFSASPEKGQIFCNQCGEDCPVWTWEARRGLSADRREWYSQIAKRLETEILVSTDKNHAKQVTLDPWLRFDVIVLFRHPRHAWQSASRPGRKPKKLEAYLRRWDEEYRKLLFSLPNQGQKIFIDFDQFRDDSDGAMKVVRQRLGLGEPEGDGTAEHAGHSLGGNARVVSAFKDQPRVDVTQERGGDALAPEVEARIERFVRRDSIYPRLRAEHDATFGPSASR